MLSYRARTFMRINTGSVRLVVVDEPSSAMDPAGEYGLFKRLREARQGKTMIFITHRFGHLTKHADVILCMKDGRLVEKGTHAELVAKKGEYYDLYNVQAQAFTSGNA
jgi:ABC-type multidrug transport system fused ATPase/permease subunit